MQNGELFQIINSPDTKKMLTLLKCRPTIEKTILAKELKISFQTLSKQIDLLKQKHILCLDSRIEINASKYYSCGISIGGGQCKVTLVDAACKVIGKKVFNETRKKANVFNQSFLEEDNDQELESGFCCFRTPDNLMDLTTKLNCIIEDIIKLYDISQRDSSIPPILSIGIALTGSIDAKKQVIIKSHNISYLKNMKREMLISPYILQSLREREIALTIDHNAKALAVCEKYSLYHSDNHNKIYQNKENIASFYLGSGVSCGLILGNVLERGCRNLNGELGHIFVPRYPALKDEGLSDSHCTCGGIGCLEQYIINDGFGMTREYFKSISSEQLKEELQGLPENEYEERLTILGYYMGWAIDLCVKLLNVGLIIFSGKMTCIMDDVWKYITYPEGNIEEGLLDCSKITSKYGVLAPAIGAGILSTYIPGENVEWPCIENE